MDPRKGLGPFPGITCPDCGYRSHDPYDVRTGFCPGGNCLRVTRRDGVLARAVRWVSGLVRRAVVRR